MPFRKIHNDQLLPCLAVKIELMVRNRFIQAASILFGVFALYCVYKAFGNMLVLVQAQVSGNSIRFAGLFLASVFGLAFLVPKTTIPALRKIAQVTDPNFVRCICFFALSALVLVSGLARLEGYVPATVFVLTILVFFSAFVWPGYAISDVDISPNSTRSLKEFQPLVLEQIKHRPLAGRLVFCATGVFLCAGLVAFTFFGHTVASESWYSQTTIPSFLLAFATTYFWASPWVQVLPKKVFLGSASKILPMSALFLVVSMFSSKALLQNGVVAFAAMTFGTEDTLSGKIVRLEPWERRRDCSGAVYVRMEGRQQEFCNLSDAFFENAEKGDNFVVIGHGTSLGLLPEKYSFSKTQSGR